MKKINKSARKKVNKSLNKSHKNMKTLKGAFSTDRTKARNPPLIKVNSGNLGGGLPRISTNVQLDANDLIKSGKKTNMTLNQASVNNFSKAENTPSQRSVGQFRIYNRPKEAEEIISKSSISTKVIKGKFLGRGSPNPLGDIPKDQRHYQSVNLDGRGIQENPNNSPSKYPKEITKIQPLSLVGHNEQVLNKNPNYSLCKNIKELSTTRQDQISNLKDQNYHNNSSFKKHKSTLPSRSKIKRK